MKTNPSKFLCCLVAAVIFTSCEKELTNMKPVEQKIVVTSFISPSDPKIKVRLSLSYPFYGSDNTTANLNLKYATVLISDGNTQKQLAWNPQLRDFELDQSDFPISTGKTYALQVKTTDGKQISAQTSIPNPVINPSFNFIEFKQTAKRTIETFRFQFTDDGTQINYYRLYLNAERYAQFQSTPVASGSEELYLGPDIEFSGSLFDRILEFNYYSNVDPSTYTNKYTAYFISCSEEYYKFHKSNPSTDSDPLRGNAVNPYSNIEGGLGIFAGYN